MSCEYDTGIASKIPKIIPRHKCIAGYDPCRCSWVEDAKKTDESNHESYRNERLERRVAELIKERDIYDERRRKAQQITEAWRKKHNDNLKG